MAGMAPHPEGGSNPLSAAARELVAILEGRDLHPVYQPILSLGRQQIYGYEALARGPEGGRLHSPLALFEVARSMGYLSEVDLLARERAIECFCTLGLAGRLFLNVTPAVLMEPQFRSGETQRFLERSCLDPSQVIIELTEHSPVADSAMLRRAVDHYREMGFTIAIDDLGSGYSGLRQWSELAPDFVKLDRHFIQDVHHDGRKRQLLYCIYEIANTLGSTVVAEGIETAQELDIIRRMGVGMVQGYYFAPPRPDPAREIDGAQLARPAGEDGNGDGRTESVAALCEPRPTLAPEASLNEVVVFFQEHPELDEVTVAHDGLPKGLVNRSEIMSIYTTRFGRDLYGRKPIRVFMDPNPRVVTESTPVEALSRRITAGVETTLSEEDFIIVDGEGRYQGMGTLMNLLHKITELQIRNARYANALTQLPGNVPINEHMDHLLSRGQTFVVAYCDLDNFKPFNDIYGYAAGDEVIRLVGRLLSEAAVDGTDFVGHVGGDDFIAVWRSPDWQERTETVLGRFAQEAPGFYTAADRARGGIQAADRNGESRFFPILSLSIGAVPAPPGRFASHTEISSVASEVKKAAKALGGDQLFVDRRADSSFLAPLRDAPAPGDAGPA